MIDLQNDGHAPVQIPGVAFMNADLFRETTAKRMLEQIRVDLKNAERCGRWIVCRSSYRDTSAYASDMVNDMGFDVAAQFLTDCQLNGWVVIFRRAR